MTSGGDVETEESRREAFALVARLWEPEDSVFDNWEPEEDVSVCSA